MCVFSIRYALLSKLHTVMLRIFIKIRNIKHRLYCIESLITESPKYLRITRLFVEKLTKYYKRECCTCCTHRRASIHTHTDI